MRKLLLPKQKRSIKLSESEIRAVYAQGEEAVVNLVSELLKQSEKLEERVEKLEGQLSKNSRNSSKPPSADGFGKRTKSLRRKSERSSGGQPGHPGHTLEWSEAVDWVERHEVHECSLCGTSLTSEAVEETLHRQVFDIPSLKVMVREHQVEVKCCPQCGQKNQADFPVEAKNVVQYGPRLKAMMVYLSEWQLLPFERSCQLLSDLLGAPISEGTLHNARVECFESLAAIEQSIQSHLINAEVVHFDETGLQVNGELRWLHVAGNEQFTHYVVHAQRGQVAIDAGGILPHFSGKAIHDGWKSYGAYECEHFLCNAHHLRELQFIRERYQQSWADQMSLLLVSILSQVQAAKAEGLSGLASEEIDAFSARYLEILAEGLAANPLPSAATDAPKKRGRPKRSPPRNLLERLQSQQASVLGFMLDFTVPFDNNQAERDLRMMKLKQKISGCFRSENGAKIFCRIRGYLSTLRKQQCNIFDALSDLFSGHPKTLVPQPE